MDSGGCGEELIFPKCTETESIAIHQLLSDCPAEMRQTALDEIEGARQAGVIKTNLVPFARGIITAIARGTFTVGHGYNVVEQRNKLCGDRTNSKLWKFNPSLEPDALLKGQAVL